MMNSSNRKICTLYCPFPDTESAEVCVRTLLKEKLIACAHILPEGHSFYEWKGDFKSEKETLVFLKGALSSSEALIQRVQELHPYEVPAVIRLEASANSSYADWIDREGESR